MATGFPTKANWVAGDILTAAQMDDLAGTLNLLSGYYTGNPSITAPIEVANVSATAATGTINIDTKTSTYWYYTTNASANFTLNFRGNSTTTLSAGLAVGSSISVVFLNTNGATPFYANAFQIDGVAVTPKWSGGTAPAAGNASAIDAYTFTIIKTAATPTYTVLAGTVKFA